MPTKTKPQPKTASRTASKTATKAAGKTAGKTASKTAKKSVPAKSAPAKTARAKAPAVKTPAVKTPATKKVAKPAKAKAAGTTKTTLRGRSVFVVQTTGKGVVVRSAWLSEDKKLMEMPAVFPDVNYALAVIDDLRKQVLDHFSRAAQVGARAIASQRKAATQKP